MKNNFLIIVIIVVGLSGIIAFKRFFQKNSKQTRWTIGIIQTASHPALDAAKNGFIDYVQKQLNNDVSFIVRNGEGSVNALHSIAHQFNAQSNIDLVYAIATPAAQALLSIEKNKPIVLAAVTVVPGIGIEFNQPNVCAISDMINVPSEIAAMHQLLPMVKTVGILFNTAEINAVSMSKVMVVELEKIGLESQLVGFSSEADIEAAVASALRKVDALIAPTDNSVANAIALISNLAQRARKPLIVSDNMLVKYGALMARGVDYYQSGKEAGMCAVQILTQHTKPYELSIMNVDTKEIFVNKKVMQELDVVIPKMVEKDVVFV